MNANDTPSDIALFSLNAGRELARQVADALGIAAGAHEEREFEDGEHKIRPLEMVHDRDVYIVQSLHAEPAYGVNEKLVRLLFFIGALRDAGAARVNVIAPYLCYARKDCRTKPRDPLSLRYLAQLFEAIGVDSIGAMDVHNPAAFENAFRCPTIHLTAQPLLVEHFAPLLAAADVVVASPDTGGIKRGERFRVALSERLQRPVGSALVEKHRSEGVVSGTLVAGEVRDCSVLLVDDLIAAGTTVRRAAEALLARGAKAVYAAASHGVFAPGAAKNLTSPALRQIVTSNSVTSPAHGGLNKKWVVVDIAPTIAGAIRHLHGIL